MLTEEALGPVLEEELHKMHFSEELSITSQEGAGFLVNELSPLCEQKMKSFSFSSGFPIVFSSDDSFSWGVFPSAIKDSFYFFSFGERKLGEDFLKTKGFSGEEKNYWEQKRILSGCPLYGKDWEKGDKALNWGFLSHIDRKKGCYPGQEAIEKSLNLGHPAKSFVILELDFALSTSIPSSFTPPLSLFCEDKKIGKLSSLEWIGEARALALGIVQWNYREAKGEWSISEAHIPVEVRVVEREFL